MNWNQTIRLIHRWLSAALTVGMVINFIAVVLHRYNNTLGLLAVLPLIFLFLSGLYLYALHYFAKWRTVARWRSVRRAA